MFNENDCKCGSCVAGLCEKDKPPCLECRNNPIVSFYYKLLNNNEKVRATKMINNNNNIKDIICRINIEKSKLTD